MYLTENYLKHAKDALSDYIKSTVPIFTFKSIEGKRKTSYVGSSFYFIYENNYFIITAKHVYKEASPFLVPLSSSQMESLQYDCVLSTTNIDIDLTLFKLTKQLTDTRFVPYELYEDELTSSFLEPRLYVALGFPGSKVRFYNKKMNGHFKLFFTTKETEQEYERLTKSEKDYLLLRFDKYDVIEDGNKKIFCNPNGMSGGCVISIDPEMIIPMRFEGILIEWDIEKKKTMIAIRKQFIKCLLNQINKSEE